MKIASLLAEFLYTNNKLDLPGIGSFRIETPQISPTDESSLPLRITILFQNDPSIKEVPDLISFIASKTGKMKALAIADLGSHLLVADQFLNIGKPFLLEGIGTLAKLRSGQYEFTQGDTRSEELMDFSKKEVHTSGEDSYSDFTKSSSYPKKIPRKLVPLLLVLAGIGIAVLAGYKIYQKRILKKKDITTKVTESQKEEAIPVNVDSSGSIQKKDTAKKMDELVIQKPVSSKGKYKFVVEEANKERALQRFNSLKSWGLPIQMETKDSINFKLFFVFNYLIVDTAKTMDSLRILYTPEWSKFYVEK